MTLDDAVCEAHKIANSSGVSVLVYKATHNDLGEYGVAYTLPMWGERVGDRIYPGGDTHEL
jgi:hypothetical protein